MMVKNGVKYGKNVVQQNDKKKIILCVMRWIMFILLGGIIILVFSFCFIGKKVDKNEIKISNFYKVSFNGEMDYPEETGGTIQSYEEYFNLEKQYQLANSVFEEKDFEKNDYIYYIMKINDCSEEVSAKSLKIANEIVTVTYQVKRSCEYCVSMPYIFFIPIEKNLNIKEVIADYYYEGEDCYVTVDKPILYLYPTEDTYVKVKLANDKNIITSYPDYQNGWEILAKENGDLYDSNGKYYYALYWDEKSNNQIDFNTGFYVTKENAIPFLEEKLSIIGFNDRERNEFIMYWLPKLENNKKSLVYFELTKERETNNKLIITPQPTSLLRVNMHIKKVEKEIEIPEQIFTTFERKGFTVVEWGGTIHN